MPAVKGEEKADPEEAVIQVDGAQVDCAPFVYLMLHKAGRTALRNPGPKPENRAGSAAGPFTPAGVVSCGAAGQGHRG